MSDKTSTHKSVGNLRELEFKLLLSAKYLVEQQGKANSHNPQERVYQSSDGTKIQHTKNSLTISQGDRELEFDNNNATVRNTFSAPQMESQIKALSTDMQQHLQTKKPQTQEWTISSRAIWTASANCRDYCHNRAVVVTDYSWWR